MAKSKYRKLKPAWLAHYDGFKFDRKLASRKNQRHHLFNKKLRNYLLSCEDNEFLPSKEFVENKCHEIQEEVDFELSLNGADKDRLDPIMMDRALSAMDFLEVLTNQDQNNNPYPQLYLKVKAIVPLRGLTSPERKFLQEAFADLGESEGDDYVLSLISTPVSSHINEQKKNDINDYLKRKAREHFKRHAKSNNLISPFKYKLLDKIKDIWVDGGI